MNFAMNIIGLGTIVNALAVIAGAALGLLLKKALPKKLGDALVSGVALCVLFIGVEGALKCTNPLVMIISMVLGTVVGTLLDLDGKIHRLGEKVEKKFSKNDGEKSTFGAAFVQSFLLFCVGAMTVTGAIESGLTGNNTTLFAKSVPLLILTALRWAMFLTFTNSFMSRLMFMLSALRLTSMML